jgi:hypothetical protein
VGRNRSSPPTLHRIRGRARPGLFAGRRIAYRHTTAMHQGRFPRSHTNEFEPRSVPRAALVEPTLDRRRWLLLIGASLAAGTGSWMARPVLGSSAAPAPIADAADGADASYGTLEWALALERQPDHVLLQAAGDLERVSMRFPDARLVPRFVRLLEVVLTSAAPEADVAGACAVRSLDRLGRLDLALRARARIAVHPALPETAAALGRKARGQR